MNKNCVNVVQVFIINDYYLYDYSYNQIITKTKLT